MTTGERNFYDANVYESAERAKISPRRTQAFRNVISSSSPPRCNHLDGVFPGDRAIFRLRVYIYIYINTTHDGNDKTNMFYVRATKSKSVNPNGSTPKSRFLFSGGIRPAVLPRPYRVTIRYRNSGKFVVPSTDSGTYAISMSLKRPKSAGL